MEQIGDTVYSVVAFAILKYFCAREVSDEKGVDSFYNRVFRSAVLDGIGSRFDPKRFIVELKKAGDERLEFLALKLETDFTLEGA